MDIHSANNMASRLNSFLKDMVESNTRIYEKSKANYNDLGEKFIDGFIYISQITQQDILGSYSGEFGSQPSTPSIEDVQMQINRLTAELAKLQEFSKVKSDIEYEQTPPSIQSSSNNITPIKGAALKDAVRLYSNTLKELANTDTGSSVANQCASLLWRWWEGRISKKYTHVPVFTYSIYRVRDILYAIVMLFGYHVENKTSDVFITQFDDWVRSLSTSPDSNRWIAPYEVYRAERNMRKHQANLTSVVLWDLLWNAGLKHIQKDDPNFPSLLDVDIYDRVNSLNRDILDNYVDYNYSPKILDDLNLI